MRLSYSLSTRVTLSLEPYHNAGLTPDETKAAIESVRDGVRGFTAGGHNLWCEPTGFNSNWAFTVPTTDQAAIADCVYRIHLALESALSEKTGKPIPADFQWFRSPV